MHFYISFDERDATYTARVLSSAMKISESIKWSDVVFFVFKEMMAYGLIRQ